MSAKLDPADIPKPDPPPKEGLRPAPSEEGIDTKRIVEIKSKATRDAEVLVLCQICDALEVTLDEAVDGEGRRFVHHEAGALMEIILAAFEMRGLTSARNELAKVCKAIGIDDRTSEDRPRNGLPPTAEAVTLATATLRMRIKSYVNAQRQKATPAGSWLGQFFRALFS